MNGLGIFGGRLLALLLALAMPSGPVAHYGHSAKNAAVLLPDSDVTPGVIRTTDASEICAPDFRTGPFRKTTASMKNKAYAEYGTERDKGICKGGCEIDHLVPLELGGLDDLRNLWPQPSQPIPGFHQKDILENYLRHAVCIDKTMALAKAQQLLMGDWYDAYLKAKLAPASKTGSESPAAPEEMRGE